MARYKSVDTHLLKLLPVRFSGQIAAGSCGSAVNWLIDNKIDLSAFDPRHHNDEICAPARDPGVLLKVVLQVYARGLVSSCDIEPAGCENVNFMALSGDTQPLFSTIASFVARLSEEVTGVFLNVLACDDLGKIGHLLSALDGVKTPSTASRTFTAVVKTCSADA